MLFDCCVVSVCCGVLAGSTAATLPALAGGGAGELALPDVALLDLAIAVWAGGCAAWAAWARTGALDAGVSSMSAATAGAASDVVR
jgi:hypothetical protein